MHLAFRIQYENMKIAEAGLREFRQEGTALMSLTNWILSMNIWAEPSSLQDWFWGVRLKCCTSVFTERKEQKTETFQTDDFDVGKNIWGSSVTANNGTITE